MIIKPGDLIEVTNKQFVKYCLVKKVKKRYHFLEIDIICNGKASVIVYDGNFYNIKVVARK